jgi:ribonuclease J
MMQENEVTQQQNSSDVQNKENAQKHLKPQHPSNTHTHKDVSQNPQANNTEIAGEQPPKKPRNNRRRKSGNKAPTASIEGNELWQRDMKKAIEANQKMHKERLNKAPLVEQNSKGKIKITPLGGLGEIGGNICVFETENSAIVLDVGMSFPSEDMHGVDILVPDFSYLRQIKKKIAGIIISHAHEDHIGAIPYLFKEMQFPLYATPLPLGMISNKFDEHGLKNHKKYFRPVEKRKIYKIGEFEIEWIHITHSIIDASSLAITTEAGTIIHTGDFKIDHTLLMDM